jgi:hypothetical protein
MSHVDRWDAEHAVARARDEQADAAYTYDARLTALLEEYAGRRSAAAELVRQVADLAVGHAAEADRNARALIVTLNTRQDMAIESLERQLDQAREHNRTLQAQLDDKRRLVEERKAATSGEEVQVTIGHSLGSWQVADLEEVAYRLRCGGAVDETPVKVTEWAAAALVPAPNLVPLTRPDRTPPPPERPTPLPDPVHVDERGPINWTRVAVVAQAIVLVLIALVVIL